MVNHEPPIVQSKTRLLIAVGLLAVPPIISIRRFWPPSSRQSASIKLQVVWRQDLALLYGEVLFS